MSTREADTALMVRRTLKSLVLSGSPGNLDAVAGRLSLHPRALNRRLRDQGLGFRSVVNEVRFEVARQLLEGTDLPVTRIGELLGYSEGAAFSHAFRRWSGTTAAAWRTGRQGGGHGPELPGGSRSNPGAAPQGVAPDPVG